MYFFPLSLGQEGESWPLEQDLHYETSELLFPPTPVTCMEQKKTPYSMAFPTVNTGHIFILSFKGKPASGLRKYLSVWFKAVAWQKDFEADVKDWISVVSVFGALKFIRLFI